MQSTYKVLTTPSIRLTSDVPIGISQQQQQQQQYIFIFVKI